MGFQALLEDVKLGRVERVAKSLLVCLNSTRLQRIVDTYDLYKSLKGERTQQGIIAQMRRDTRVEVPNLGDFVSATSLVTPSFWPGD